MTPEVVAIASSMKYNRVETEVRNLVNLTQN